MSKLNISFNDKNYNIDKSALSDTRTDFVSHLGTIAGEGLKIVVDGVVYNVDPTKLNDASSGLEALLDSLGGSAGGDTDILTAGLYQSGTNVMTTSWDELLSSGAITVKDGTLTKANSDVIVGHLVLPDDGSVTQLGSNAFYSCRGLTNITISNSVTSIKGYALGACSGLTSVTIPESVTSISDNAFYNCYKIVEVINKSSLPIALGQTAHGSVAYWAKEIHNGTTKIVNQNDYLFYTYDGVNYLLGYIGADTELILPETYNGQDYSIYNYAFNYCNKLTSITIPNIITVINVYTFTNCTGLANVTIGNGVIRIDEYAFSGCTGLTSVTIPNNVKSIGRRAFSGCKNLSEIYFTGTAKEWQTVPSGAHWNYNVPATYVQCSDSTVAL